jgi:hypothetical protein
LVFFGAAGFLFSDCLLLLLVLLAILRDDALFVLLFFFVLAFDFGALRLAFFLAGIAAVYHFVRTRGRATSFSPRKARRHGENLSF